MGRLAIEIKSILKSTKLGTYIRKKRWNKSLLHPGHINKTISTYLGELSVEEKQKIFDDIVNTAKKYRFSADEYFCYHFLDKNEEERKTFISDLNRIDFCERLNKAKNLSIFDDKMRSAEVFAEFYGRDICGIRGSKDIEAFRNFLKKHERFILKPNTGTCGQGIKILTISPNDQTAIENLVKEYCSKAGDGFIVEELVVQSAPMAQFHASSLNTVRLATIKYDDRVEVIASFFRMGRGGNIVDNAGAGGVFGTVDVETGVVDAVGDEYGNSYTHHPDTNIEIVGFQIPRWNEAVETAKKLATIVSGNRYAGWDLALTDSGWIMIEGNARGQFVWQMPRQKGFMDQANDILKNLGMKPMKNLGI